MVEPEAAATLPPPAIETEEEGGDEGDKRPFLNQPTPEPEPTPEPSGPITPWAVEDFGYGVQIHGNATYGDPDVLQWMW